MRPISRLLAATLAVAATGGFLAVALPAQAVSLGSTAQLPGSPAAFPPTLVENRLASGTVVHRVFSVLSNNTVWAATELPTLARWSDFRQVAGLSSFKAVAVVESSVPGEIEVVTTGSDGSLFENRLGSDSLNAVVLNSPIPGGLHTSDGPSLSKGVNEDRVLYARDSSTGQVRFNIRRPLGWTGWGTIPPDVGFTPADAPVAWGNYTQITSPFDLLVVARDASQRAYIKFDGQPAPNFWTLWTEIPGNGRLIAPPAVARSNGSFLVFGIGTDTRLYWNIRSTSGTWTGWTLVDSSTGARWVTAAGNFVVVTQNNSIMIVRRISPF
jgi:hypothetical protein